MYEFFIGKRYLRSKHKINLISVISIISTIGITIGVAALIIVISVFNGFGSLVKSILINFDPHVIVYVESELSENDKLSLNNWFEAQDGIERYYTFAEGNVILQNGRNYQVISLKGITEQDSSNSWGIKTSLIKGDIDFNDDASENIYNILISQRMAIRLSCSIGDTLTVSTFSNLERMIIDFTAIPQTRLFRVSGIFATDNKDYDIIYAYTALDCAITTLQLKNKITGYEIRLKNIDDSDNFKQRLLSYFGNTKIRINTWYDLHKDLYNVMQIERWSAFILLSLIISVATFNILGSLTMSVIEKKRDIGILRSMGAKVNSITKIFMFEGILIGVIGTSLGLAIGLIVCYLQIEYKIYALDPAKYIIDAIPVKLQFIDILTVTTASLFLTFIASLYPSRRASKVNLIEAIKYE